MVVGVCVGGGGGGGEHALHRLGLSRSCHTCGEIRTLNKISQPASPLLTWNNGIDSRAPSWLGAAQTVSADSLLKFWSCLTKEGVRAY